MNNLPLTPQLPLTNSLSSPIFSSDFTVKSVGSNISSPDSSVTESKEFTHSPSIMTWIIMQVLSLRTAAPKLPSGLTDNLALKDLLMRNIGANPDAVAILKYCKKNLASLPYSQRLAFNEVKTSHPIMFVFIEVIIRFIFLIIFGTILKFCLFRA